MQTEKGYRIKANFILTMCRKNRWIDFATKIALTTIFCLPNYAIAQNNAKLDSLLQRISIAKNDTSKAREYIEISKIYTTIGKPDSGFEYAKLGLHLSDSLGWDMGSNMSSNTIGQYFQTNAGDFRLARQYFDKAAYYGNKALATVITNPEKNKTIIREAKSRIAGSYMNIGTTFAALGDYDSAIIFHTKGLSLFTDINDSAEMAQEFEEIGTSASKKGDYKVAFENDFRALTIRGLINDSIGIANTDLVISDVCRKQGDFNKAKDYLLNAVRQFQTLVAKNKGKERSMYNQYLANSYQNMAIFYNDQQKFDSALVYDEYALSIYDSLDFKEGVAAVLATRGDVNRHVHRLPDALEDYLRGLKISTDIGNSAYAEVFLGDIGEVYLAIYKDSATTVGTSNHSPASKSESLRLSIDYLNKALKAAKDGADKESIVEFSQAISEAYKLSGNFKGAYENYLLYTAVKDTLNNIDARKQLSQEEAKSKKIIDDVQIKLYDAETKAKEDRAKVLYYGIVVLIFIIGLVVRSNIKQNKSNKIITREKKRSDELLLNILPAEVAEELKDKGSAEAKYFQEVTVFFSDFVGFTKVAERMTPQQLVNELDACFKGFDHIMTKYNIEKIKTVGDAYLAVSGLPVGDPMHAEKVIKAAIEIREFQLERKKQLGDMTFEVRIGCHTGSVVAGIVGVKKFAYDIWGDTVNTAARMEQNSMPGKINISEVTYNIIKEKFDCTFRGKIQAKNKGELSMYFVETATEGEYE